MESSSKHLIFVAGEASGDMHAAHLVRELKRLRPDITFSGLGGPQMQQEGVKLYADLTKIAVVGFWEVLKHFSLFKKNFDLILAKIKEEKPVTVILIDYPGFNLRLAAKIKELGEDRPKVIYYISPQLWAWKESRIKIIRECVDKMIVILPFEKDFYARRGVNVDYVGHPLLDGIRTTKTKDQLLSDLGLSPQKPTIGLLPGSRQKEVSLLLPLMIQAAKKLYQQNPDFQFLVLKAPTLPKAIFEQHLSLHLPLRLLEDKTYDGINACDLCCVASGTATLETALLGKPMIVVYKTSLLTWALAKLLIKIPYIGLVNVIAGKKIVPECVQFNATPHTIAREITNILANPSRQEATRAELNAMKSSLGNSGATQRAAQKIIGLL